MAEQTLAAPAPAPALVFAARAPTELLKQLYGDNEDFLEVPFLPPSLAGAFAGGHKDIDGKIVFPRSIVEQGGRNGVQTLMHWHCSLIIKLVLV
jgi:hypothetical protein